MPKKITIIGYTIKELEPKVREEVVNRYSEINTNHDWFDGCYEGFDEKLAEYGLECMKRFEWDLYRNDFEFNGLNIKDQKLLLSKLEVSKDLIPLELKTNGNYIIEMGAKDCYVKVDITDDYAMTCPDITMDELQEVEDAIGNKLSSLIEDLQSQFLKVLKDDYEYLTSEEAIVDSLDANDYLFTKEGKTI
jgi:hypothetical protein